MWAGTFTAKDKENENKDATKPTIMGTSRIDFFMVPSFL
jgi:hypothetical protein